MKRLALEGSWRLRRLADGSVRPISIPGDILSALVASGEAPDPYYGMNELDLQWIGREDWALEREFELDERFLSAGQVFLEAESIDTVAELELNGRPLGRSSDMFRRFRADARALLSGGTNLLSVLIRSPEKAAAEAAAALSYPVPCSTYPVSSPHRNLLRKAQCMSGWDWGPCLMTGGIYDGIGLVALDGPRIEYATTSSRPERGDDTRRSWSVRVKVELEASAAMEAELEIELAGARATRRLSLGAGSSVHIEELMVEGVESWWPAGYGAQPLYDLVVACRPASGAAGGGAAAGGPGGHELRKRVGFRELELLNEENEAGKSMTFRVNGREVFCKGANWIPADALPARWSKARVEGLLRSAVEANMNCLRVWGGGRYESDYFYELCDGLGLLVWQDLMFSCALYPSSPEFLGEVEAELRHQVRRLQDHPALALWCGNNEALGAITWYEESRSSPTRYVVDYDRLTEGVAGRVVRELDPGRPWWPSSPSAGPNDFSDNWHSDSRGDMHYWSVWHEGKPFSAYLDVKPRFCSEFGFQSLSSYETAASFLPPGEFNITSPSMEHHQRHPRGNTIILETMSRYFRMPSGFRETLYLSQVQQALAIRTAVSYWRSLMPHCMGTLYWQLNDLWPVASWSSLEYDGGWKLLHYEARRFFDPVYLSLFVKDGVIHAVGVNDGEHAVLGDLVLCLRRFDGSLLMDIAADGDLAPRSATELWKMPIASLPCLPEDVYLAAHLEGVHAGLPRSPGSARPHSVAPAGSSIDGVPSVTGGRAEILRRSQLFLTEPKRCSLVDPRLEAHIEEGGKGPVLQLTAHAPAFYIEARAEGIPGRFDDAGFYMLGGETRRLRFITPEGASAPSASKLRSALRIMHLRASYE
ncbi:MAG TPA: glycoside hydrolase family 2 protein [Rectinemataceae bacterium]|nr:glycoside hydrolase family 2 protein [Rectinemataceae bacterium]